MPSEEYLINLLGLAFVLTTIVLAIVITLKMEKMKRMKSEIDNLKRSLNEMDEQAKLIVRTDMELNKIQEELDKKINGLYALQKLSRTISTTLEENQIFKMIDAVHLKDLGFERVCVFLWAEKEKRFLLRLYIGYTEDEIKRIGSFADSEKSFYLNLIQNNKTLSPLSASGDTSFKEKINQIFKVHSFIISPVLPKEGSKGFIFLGTENIGITISEGDEELITIFANQIGQALENARLFEKTWRAQQDLEKKVEERTHELKVALEELKLISKRKSDFISAVSHELRTPLTSIKGYASILLTGKLGHIPEDMRIRLDKINRHSDELTYLVNDLLDISRIESGKVIMKKEPQEVTTIMAEVSDLLSVQLKEKQIELSMKISEEANTVLADPTQINRVFINIIGNAIKFTPQKGKISVSSHKVDKLVEIDITDTGCGIPEEAQKRIFEEFYRVDNQINQEVKGSGLGLSLVKYIVEAHGGKIWVKSKIGQGSTFSFTFQQTS